MPQYPQPSQMWLAQALERVKADAAALKAQSTQYIVDEARVCQAIIGNLASAPTATGSETTGLQGWGLAARDTGGQWVSVGGEALSANGSRAREGYRHVDYGADYVEWTSTGTESAKREVRTSFPNGELATIQLTGVGTGVLFRINEGGPYNNKFNVIGHGPTYETIGPPTRAYFFWLAIGN